MTQKQVSFHAEIKVEVPKPPPVKVHSPFNTRVDLKYAEFLSREKGELSDSLSLKRRRSSQASSEQVKIKKQEKKLLPYQMPIDQKNKEAGKLRKFKREAFRHCFFEDRDRF